MRKPLSLAICGAAFGWMVLACEAAAGPLDTTGASKSLICSACHGFGGNSPDGTVPALAGMSSVYFKKAIEAYAQGRRLSPEMEPYSKYVVQFGLDDIAAYFAAQKRQPARAKADPNAVKRGMAAAVQCASCHGAKGEGDAEKGVPDLRGQRAGYLQTQMNLLKDDKRKLDDPALDGLKKQILSSLGDRDVGDVAAYYASLR